MDVIFRGTTEIDTSAAVRVPVDAPNSAPCRRCLTDIEVGDTALLVSYDPFDPGVDTPYRTASPVFVHERRCTPYAGGDVPEQQRRRLLSVRSFDPAGIMLDAEVVEGSRLETTLDRQFANERAAFVHVHNAKPGCFAVRVDRA